MTSKLHRLLVAGVLLAAGTVVCSAAEVEFTYDGLKYSTYGNEAVSLIGYETAPEGHFTIPSSVEYNGRTRNVVRVTAGAFKDCSTITELTVPSIVSSLGENSFYGCTSLAKINFSEGLTHLGGNAFRNTAITEVTTPYTLNNLGNSVFGECHELRTAIINGHMPQFQYLFGDDENLELVHMPNSLVTIDNFSFQSCVKLTKINYPSKVTKLASSNFRLMAQYVRTFNIPTPDTIRTPSASYLNDFKNCEFYVAPGTKDNYLKSTTWQEFISSCSLGKVGDDYKYRKNNTLYEAVAIEETGITCEYDTLHATATVTGLSGTTPASLTIPAAVLYDHRIYQVTAIADGAFSGQTAVRTLMLPHTLTAIGNNAFASCSGLQQIYSAATEAPTLGASAFSGVPSTCILAVNNGCRDSYAAWTPLSSNIVIAADPETSQLKYSFSIDTENNTATITKCYKDYLTQGMTLEIPAYVCSGGKFYPVTTLGEKSFYNVYQPVEIVVPETATTWGEGVFYSCRNLEKINIPAGLTSLPTRAFYVCNKLDNVTLPAGLTSIGGSCFGQCSSLSSMVIPEGCKDIKGGAFEQCSVLETINLPEGMTEIPSRLFSLCYKLKNVTIPSTVTSVGESAFAYCQSMTEINLPDGVTSIGPGALQHTDMLSHFTLPPKVTVLSQNLFLGSGITEFTIPANVTTVSDWAFNYCRKLETITFEGSVPPTFGSSNQNRSPFESTYNVAFIAPEDATEAYLNADGWKEMFDDADNGNILVQDYTASGLTYGFDEENGTAAVSGIAEGNDATDIVVPSTILKDGKIYKVISVAADGFKNAAAMTSVVLPVSVETIGDNAFAGCTALSAIKLPANVTSVGNGAFAGCTSVETLNLNARLTEIGAGAFSGCTALTSLELPQALATLGTEAFKNCAGIKEVTCLNPSPATFGTGTFTGLENCVFYVPNGSANDYKEAAGWKEFFADTTNYISDTVEASETDFRYDFDDNTLAATVTSYNGSDDHPVIPDKVRVGNKEYTVTAIDAGAFERETFSTIDIPATVTTIGEGAFAQSQITSITIPEGVTELPYGAFMFCTNLAEINLPQSLTTIRELAVVVTSITTIDIPASVTSIGMMAFSYNPQLIKVTVHSETPATLDENVFNSPEMEGLQPTNVQSCALEVPQGSEQVYMNDPQWGEFIINPSSTGIESITVLPSVADGVWTVAGTFAGNSTEGLQPGLYIIVRGGKASKLYVR